MSAYQGGGTTKGMTALPAANEYLYLTNGEAVGGTFTRTGTDATVFRLPEQRMLHRLIARLEDIAHLRLYYDEPRVPSELELDVLVEPLQ